MGIAIRKKDGKFYGPGRDINNWFAAACRASIRMAAEVFKDDQQALQRLQECGVVLAEIYNDALLADKQSVQQVLRKAAQALRERPNEFAVLAHILTMIVFWRFISGAREMTDTPELTENDLSGAMTDAAMLAILPDDLSVKVERALRLSGQWPAPAFDLPALFAVAEETDNAGETPCLKKTSE